MMLKSTSRSNVLSLILLSFVGTLAYDGFTEHSVTLVKVKSSSAKWPVLYAPRTMAKAAL